VDHKEWAKRIVGADWTHEMSDDYSKYNRGRIAIDKMISDSKSEDWSTRDINKIKQEINSLLDGNLLGVYSEKGREAFMNKVEWLNQFQKKEVEAK